MGGMLRTCKMSKDGCEFGAEIDGRVVNWTIPLHVDLSELNFDMLSLSLEFYLIILSRSVENLFADLGLIYPVPLKYLDLKYLVEFLGFDPSLLNEPNNRLHGKSFYVETRFKEATTFIIISFGGKVYEEWGNDDIGYEVLDFGLTFDDSQKEDGRVYCDTAHLMRFVMSNEEDITTDFLNKDENFEDASEEFVQSLKARAESRYEEMLSWTNVWVQERCCQQEEVLFAVQLIHFVVWCDNFDSEGGMPMKWRGLCLEWQRELMKAKVLTLSGKYNDRIDLAADVCGMHMTWTIHLFQDSDIQNTYGFDSDMLESTMIFYQELFKYTLKEFKARNIEQDSRSENLFEGDVFYLKTVNDAVFGFLITAFGGEVRYSNDQNERINFEVIDEGPVNLIPGVARRYCNSNWIIGCIQTKNQETPLDEFPAGRLVVPDNDEVVPDDDDDDDEDDEGGDSEVDDGDQ